MAKKIAAQRDHSAMAKIPQAVATKRTPTMMWTQPHVVKSAISTPWPPTVTTLSLRTAPRPQMKPKTPFMKSTTATKTAQPLGSVPRRGEAPEVAMRCPFHRAPCPNRRAGVGEPASPTPGEHRVDRVLDPRVDGHHHRA